jgi:SlyX protein
MARGKVAEIAGDLKNILASGARLSCNRPMSDVERLTKLEERYAHLQRHMVEQDKAMLELGELVSRLKKEIVALKAQAIHGTPEPGGASATDERPPHY